MDRPTSGPSIKDLEKRFQKIKNKASAFCSASADTERDLQKPAKEGAYRITSSKIELATPDIASMIR